MTQDNDLEDGRIAGVAQPESHSTRRSLGELARHNVFTARPGVNVHRRSRAVTPGRVDRPSARHGSDDRGDDSNSSPIHVLIVDCWVGETTIIYFPLS